MAKYYYLPLILPGPLQQQIIDACPIDLKVAIRVDNLVDLLQPIGYSNTELGCCMMLDGSGYITAYRVCPNCIPKMLEWYFHWMNVHAKGMPADHNLKYKMWNPVDHVDHRFVNGKDKNGGYLPIRSPRYGQGIRKWQTNII